MAFSTFVRKCGILRSTNFIQLINWLIVNEHVYNIIFGGISKEQCKSQSGQMIVKGRKGRSRPFGIKKRPTNIVNK